MALYGQYIVNLTEWLGGGAFVKKTYLTIEGANSFSRSDWGNIGDLTERIIGYSVIQFSRAESRSIPSCSGARTRTISGRGS
jgi:hypothetical protein